MIEKILYIDTETTGISTNAGVVEIAAFAEFDGKEVDRFHSMIRPFPEDKIEDEALRVNGLTEEDLASFDTPEKVFTDFTYWLGKYIDKYDRSDKFYFCAFNAAFDVGHMRSFFRKNDNKYFGSWFWNPALDCAMFAAWAVKKRRHEFGDFKQVTVAESLGIVVDSSKLHGAVYDAELCRRIFKQSIKIIQGEETF
jgi:DNA polymerase-3 subunit epsilon